MGEERIPIWPALIGTIVALLSAGVSFISTQLWSQGQSIAALFADFRAHDRIDENEQQEVNKIEERQQINTKKSVELAAQLEEIIRRLDRVDKDDISRLQRQIDDIKSKK